MRVHIVPGLFLFASLTLSASWAQAQVAADIAAEPHHRLLLQNDQVRVFGFKLKPNEQAYVKQDHNSLMVTLEDCEMVVWSEGHSDVTSFAFKQGYTHFSYAGPPVGFRDARNQECSDVIVEFLDPKVTTYGYDPATNSWDYNAVGISDPVDPTTKFVGAFSISIGKVVFAHLLPGDSFPAPENKTAELLISVTDVDLKTKGDVHIRKPSGAALWMGTDRQSDLTNAGGVPARFVMVQLQAPAGK
jgi:hypothetical protein